jgi:hypothetical protein
MFSGYSIYKESKSVAEDGSTKLIENDSTEHIEDNSTKCTEDGSTKPKEDCTSKLIENDSMTISYLQPNFLLMFFFPWLVNQKSLSGAWLSFNSYNHKMNNIII